MGDYDYEPKSKPGKFLRLKDKGQVVKVRLVTPPYRNVKVWKEGVREPMADDQAAQLSPEQWYKLMSDPDFTISESFCWGVIDREDGQARVLQATAGVYRSVKEYAEDNDWGDPTGYDITITRTEQPGRSYYDVKPSPNKTPLTITEQDKVKADIDFTKDMPNARPVNAKQIDDIDDYVKSVVKDKSEAFEAAQSAKREVAQPDKVHDVDLDKPISLDDIPF